ncbi:MAG TPA: class I SAM-dependent methyltransferase [Trebonia sp.]|nr:class I SAM-dependent methyltransferase [Trebonia sp.]
MPDRWADRAFLRGSQYKTDVNLAARQSIYAYQHPRIDLAARLLDLAGPAPSGLVVDIGCGNGMYLAELARRGFPGRVLGVDLSAGMLSAARQRLTSAPSATAVALAVADATALPLPGSAASLALAMHMLYHVPDPAEAVRELRRVTRPGGRAVIGLNGAGHLRQLRAAVAAAAGNDPATLVERIGLDDGETLARSFFARVTRHDFVTELQVPAAGPLADYLRSTAGTSHAVGSEQVEAVLAAIPRSPEGHFVISAHAGCLICEP